MTLPIYVEPQAVLHQPTEPIIEITPEVRELVLNMRETMQNAKGIGLAAPQIGQSIALCMMEYSPKNRPEDEIPFTVLINPQIIWRSEEKVVMEEGCLSIPGTYGDVKRPRKVTVKFIDIDGKPRELTVDNLFARVVQHELDHLKGVLFTDYVADEKRTFREPLTYPKI